MARVEIRPSGAYRYAVVVEDVLTGNGWKKKTLKSFGNADRPESVNQAYQFCAAYNAASELQKQQMLNAELLKSIAKGVAWAGAAALLAKLLFDEE